MNRDKLLTAYDIATGLLKTHPESEEVEELRGIIRELVKSEMNGGITISSPNTSCPKYPAIPTCTDKPYVTWSNTTAGSVNEGGAR